MIKWRLFNSQVLRQIGRYVISGFIAVGANFLSFLFLTRIGSVDFQVSAIISLIISFFTSFVLQKFWTFSRKEIQKTFRQLFLFLGVFILDLLINITVLSITVKAWFWADWVGQIVSLGMIALVNFILFRVVVFRAPVVQNQEKKSLWYVANVRIPTEKAHGIQIINMCHALALDDRYQVQLVVPSRNNPSFQDSPTQYYGVENNFSIVQLQVPDPIWLMNGPRGIYIKVQSILFLVSLFLFFTEFPDRKRVLYTRDEYLLPMLQRFSDRVVWEAHNLPIQKKYYKRYWMKCERIIAISHGLARELIQIGISKDKLFIAPDAVNLKLFHPRLSSPQAKQLVGLPSEKKIIMYSGHLYEWKGAQVLLRAAKDVFREGKELKWLFVPSGGMPEEVEKFRSVAIGLKNVLILGHLSFHKIPNYLQAADALVLPNLADLDISARYTSPLKLFEYLAAGRPIVASNLPSLREILNEEVAVFFKPDNPESLINAIEQIFRDKNLADSISQKASLLAQEYTWDRRAQKIMDLLSSKTGQNL